uniref:Uncharacterized protein n=1 Tax=Romanomermis culicivorax TaxID=13658 RepID=A0A915HZ11_ROMCU
MFVRSVQPIDGRFNGLAKLELNRSINFTPKIHEINVPPSEFCDQYANLNVSNCGLLVAVYNASSKMLPAAVDRLLSARISRSETCFPSDAIETHNIKCLELEEEMPCQVLEWSSVSLKIGDLFYLVGVTMVNTTCGEDSVDKVKFVPFMDICNVVSDQFMFSV